MYLSKIVLNERDRTVQRDLGNAHALHQRMMHAFPDESHDRPREEWQILFRQEPDSAVILVQSAIMPDWSKLPSGYMSHQSAPIVKLFDLDQDQLAIRRIFQFRLRANPSKRDNQTKKTIGLWHPADQEAWLRRQGDRWGFQIQGVDVIPSPNVFGRKGGQSAPIRISTALYQGILEVTDPERLLQALYQGIGRGKSYGCGLLSIARLSS